MGPVASSTDITLSIALLEPATFLRGRKAVDPSKAKSAVIRGKLQVQTKRTVQVSCITVLLRGRAITDWPGGIPEYDEFLAEAQVCFSDNTALIGETCGPPGYQEYIPYIDTGTSSQDVSDEPPFATKRQTRNHGRSVEDSQTFPVGSRSYNFEFTISSWLPETTHTRYGTVKYELEAIVERPGLFKPTVRRSLEVPVIRTPAEDAPDLSLSRQVLGSWNDRLLYSFQVAGKAFSLGSYIPVSVALHATGKVVCQEVKIFVTEYVKHYRQNGTLHYFQPEKDVLLFGAQPMPHSQETGSCEKVYLSGSGDKLKQFNNELQVILQEDIRLPGCHEMTTGNLADKLHIDSSYKGLVISHRIKVVLSFSTQEAPPDSKQNLVFSRSLSCRILSCRASPSAFTLPEYVEREPDNRTPPESMFGCDCAKGPLDPS